MTAVEIEERLNLLRLISKIVHPTERIRLVRDMKDDIIIECAIKAKTYLIITGDKDFLTLGKFRSIQSIKPREFLELL